MSASVHHILEIVFTASVLVWVVTHASAFAQVTSSLGNAYGSGVATIEGIG